MATSWLIMLMPYFLPIVILAVLHVMDRRHRFSKPVPAVLRPGARANAPESDRHVA